MKSCNGLLLELFNYLGVRGCQGNISHDLLNPLFKRLIVSLGTFKVSEFCIIFGIRCDYDKVWKVLDLILLGHLPDYLSVNL